MNDSVSQNVLLAIVHALRRTCKKKIKCENFTVISGFLSCDVDGKAKHQFVISEIINRENKGEGYSSFLKVIDWNSLRKRISSQRNEKACQQSTINSVKHNPQGKYFKEDQIKSRCDQTRSRTRQSAVEKCLSGPVSQRPFTRSRNRLSNQTFTLEDFHVAPSNETVDCNLQRNFSSATISIAGSKMLLDHQVQPEVNKKQKFPKRNSSTKILTSASVRSFSEDNGSQFSLSESHNDSYLNNFSDQLSLRSKSSQARVNNKPTKTINPKNIIFSKASKYTQKLSKPGSNNFKYQCTKLSSKRSARQVGKLHRLSSNGDSDVNIDAIRPRYLVKHNDELLLPCPNLSSKCHKHLATTKNNNRAHYMNTSSKICEESVQNTSHISSLFSSIIGALSYSGYTNMHFGSNKCDALVNLNVDKLKRSDGIDDSSNDSLKSVSSLETDSLKSGLNKTVQPPNGESKIFTKKMAYGRGSDIKEIGKSSSLVKQVLTACAMKHLRQKDRRY